MTTWQPDQQWLADTFAWGIRDVVFADIDAERDAADAVLLGGQPGAGKTRAANFAQDLYEGQLVVINGDDFRAFHPHFKRLQRDEPAAMPQVTASVSGPLVEMSIRYAREHRISVLVEGTFRSSEVALGTAKAFHDAGFRVHVIVLAVPPDVSAAGAQSRFWDTLGTDQNRWTPPDAHQAAVAGMPATVAALAADSAVERMTMMDRDGHVLADSATPGTDRAEHMRKTLAQEHRRPLTDTEQTLISQARQKTRLGGLSGVKTIQAAADPWLLLFQAPTDPIATSAKPSPVQGMAP